MNPGVVTALTIAGYVVSGILGWLVKHASTPASPALPGPGPNPGPVGPLPPYVFDPTQIGHGAIVQLILHELGVQGLGLLQGFVKNAVAGGQVIPPTAPAK